MIWPKDSLSCLEYLFVELAGLFQFALLMEHGGEAGHGVECVFMIWPKDSLSCLEDLFVELAGLFQFTLPAEHGGEAGRALESIGVLRTQMGSAKFSSPLRMGLGIRIAAEAKEHTSQRVANRRLSERFIFKRGVDLRFRVGQDFVNRHFPAFRLPGVHRSKQVLHQEFGNRLGFLGLLLGFPLFLLCDRQRLAVFRCSFQSRAALTIDPTTTTVNTTLR